jgi:hypothetical protein
LPASSNPHSFPHVTRHYLRDRSLAAKHIPGLRLGDRLGTGRKFPVHLAEPRPSPAPTRKDLGRLNKNTPYVSYSTSTDISKFRSRGGKIIWYHGMSDPLPEVEAPSPTLTRSRLRMAARRKSWATAAADRAPTSSTCSPPGGVGRTRHRARPHYCLRHEFYRGTGDAQPATLPYPQGALCRPRGRRPCRCVQLRLRRNSLTVSGDEVSAPVCRRPRHHVSQIAGRGSNRTIPTEWLGRRPVRLLSVRVQAVTVTENCSCNAV